MQQEGCTIAFDLGDFVVSKPSHKRPQSVISVDFLRPWKKLHKTCDPAKTAGTRFFPGYFWYPTRNRYSRHGNQLRQPHTFNAVLMSLYLTAKTCILGVFRR